MHTHTHGHTQEASVAGVVSLVVLAVGLTVTAADLPMAWLVWPLGYGVVLPLAIGYAARREASDDHDDSPADPAERLRQRYVEGEIDELEFERKLEHVIETEAGDGR
jgi:hypothetical protein